MLFLVTQTHSPQTCPIEVGGPDVLHAKAEDVPGLRVVATYGAFPEHVLYYVIEADEYGAVRKFLEPGYTRCTAEVTPVDKFMDE